VLQRIWAISLMDKKVLYLGRFTSSVRYGSGGKSENRAYFSFKPGSARTLVRTLKNDSEIIQLYETTENRFGT
jgi:hypothetical protein